MRACFIHDPQDLDAAVPGGVQLCSREFLEIIRAAASETRLLPVRVATDPARRLRRKLGLGSYLLYSEDALVAALRAEGPGFRPTHVFLNRAELLRLAPAVRRVFPDAKVVLLSHGNQSGDDLYEVAGPAGRRAAGWARLAATWRLGLDLVTESAFRHRHLHAVCVMTKEEEVLERWMGARRTLVLPRLVRPAPLDHRPVPGRMGYVGTLDHTPNRVSVEEVCAALARRGAEGLELRLVGGPASVAASLAARHAFVRPLGRLDDDALRAEVAGWSLFLNPILWLSRGASMKLATALAWGLPVLSTRSGARGYEWREGGPLLVADDADAFARRALEALRAPGALDEAARDCRRAAASGPDIAELAARLRETLPDPDA